MKKILTLIGTICLSLTAWANVQQDSDTISCDSLARFYHAQPFFCECEYNSIPFAFPIDTVISDTVWYTATVEDLKQGISAYWFADCSVTMEVYALCQSNEPTFTLTIGRNQMREMDVNTINKKIEEMGKAVTYLQYLTPHMRVYPHDGGSGRVYCYPYDQGPHSVCEDPMPFRAGMTYICQATENVYRMAWTEIATSGKSFIRWKQAKNLPADIRLTLDSCDGEEMARVQLSDSLHVFMPDTIRMREARTAKRDIWVHVSHAEGATGRLYYYRNPQYMAPGTPVNKTTCEGKKQTFNLRAYSTDTTFTDTVCVARDTLQVTSVSFTFTPPTMEYDTVEVASGELSRGYVHWSGHVLNTYGDTVVDIVKANTCTRRIQVTVLQPEGTPILRSEGRKAVKRIINGQLFILVDDKIYNVLGQQVK